MSDLFRLSGKLKNEPFIGGGGGPSLYRKQPLEVSHIRSLLQRVENIYDRFRANSLIGGVLLSLRYRDVVSKSRRVQSFFKAYRGPDSDKYIVGAKIDPSGKRPKHIITYYVPKPVLQTLIHDGYAILDELADTSVIQNDELKALSDKGSVLYRRSGLKSARVARLLADCSNVEDVFTPQGKKTDHDSLLVTLFDVDQNAAELLSKLGISFAQANVWDDHSVWLSKAAYEALLNEAGYLVAMTEVRGKEDLCFDTGSSPLALQRSLPAPTNEPVIGVIDTSYDDTVYYSSWVEVDDRFLLSPPYSIEDKIHATEVCSILVDGPTLNPDLDDHCGRFKVRLFPVAHSGMNSWINIASAVRKIVQANPDIHVWNLSLGSNLEVDDNYISPMASILDELQNDDPNLLFVVAGTNLPKDKVGTPMKVGAPADSINSLVVNSADRNGHPTSYARKGPVLSFFRKPDVSYYGGDDIQGIKVVVYGDNEDSRVGTSLSAPWIARKACFMMDVLGFNREETKALLIDSSLSFEQPVTNLDYLGYGVVPIAIEDVVETHRDEIRFILKGQSETYYTSTYDLPFPIVDNSFPFKARVVLASTLECDRNKGVDYTSEELAVSFGRIKNGKILTINGDKQDESGAFTDGETSRYFFRKWDNIKVIQQILQKKRVALKNYDDMGRWGLRVSCKLRNDAAKHQRKTRFAAVVTLKEIYGQDRSNEFERLCISRGWLVERINVVSKVELYNVANTEIEWK